MSIQKFYRWTVISTSIIKSRTIAYCECDCGVRRYVNLSKIKNGKSKSCGCLARELSKARLFKEPTTDVKIDKLFFKKHSSGLFSVSACGSILGRSGKLLKLRDNGKGYKTVSYLNALTSKRVNIYVHRLVAETWIPNPLGLKYVNHKDGNKSNNHCDNLEWVTATENTNHAILKGLSWNQPKKGQRGFQRGKNN